MQIINRLNKANFGTHGKTDAKCPRYPDGFEIDEEKIKAYIENWNLVVACNQSRPALVVNGCFVATDINLFEAFKRQNAPIFYLEVTSDTMTSEREIIEGINKLKL